MDILEGTAEFNRGHQLVTGEIPITVSDDEVLDMFTDNTPLACGIENPEGCESCD